MLRKICTFRCDSTKGMRHMFLNACTIVDLCGILLMHLIGCMPILTIPPLIFATSFRAVSSHSIIPSVSLYCLRTSYFEQQHERNRYVWCKHAGSPFYLFILWTLRSMYSVSQLAYPSPWGWIVNEWYACQYVPPEAVRVERDPSIWGMRKMLICE